MKQKKAEQKTEGLKSKNWNSRNIFLVLLVGVILSSCLTTEPIVFQKAKEVRAKELNGGPCYSLIRNIKKSNKSPSGNKYYSDSFRILETTDTVEAKLGAQFGIEYILLAETRGYVTIKIVWTFPEEMTNSRGKIFDGFQYKTSQKTFERTNVSYRLGKGYMLIKGEWKLEIYHKKKRILEKTFYLV